MKKNITAIVLISMLLATTAFAQKKTAELKIKTSAVCEMCKSRIETAMAYEKGVISSSLDLETKILTLEYKTGKTTPEKIRKAVNELGYDADNTMADEKAYAKLPPCCKKPDDPEHIAH